MWDPVKYLDFADERARPFHDLLARVGAAEPRRVIDLGCGPGNLTGLLAQRWPAAVVEGLDSSPEMVGEARAAGVTARIEDIDAWTPLPDTDVVVSNAALQWVPGHRRLLDRWAGELPPGSWLAVQVPGNFDAPSHVAARELAAEAEWSAALAGVLRSADVVDGPQGYGELLAARGCSVDAWETTYLHRLAGPDAVLEWITGTALRPVRAVLDGDAWARFREQLAIRLRAVYPAAADGTVWFPFRRVFVVARMTG